MKLSLAIHKSYKIGLKVFNFNMLSAILLAILDDSYYKKLQKWLPRLCHSR